MPSNMALTSAPSTTKRRAQREGVAADAREHGFLLAKRAALAPTPSSRSKLCRAVFHQPEPADKPTPRASPTSGWLASASSRVQLEDRRNTPHVLDDLDALGIRWS